MVERNIVASVDDLRDALTGENVEDTPARGSEELGQMCLNPQHTRPVHETPSPERERAHHFRGVLQRERRPIRFVYVGRLEAETGKGLRVEEAARVGEDTHDTDVAAHLVAPQLVVCTTFTSRHRC